MAKPAEGTAKNAGYPPATNTDNTHGSPRLRYLTDADTATNTSSNPYTYDVARSQVPVRK